MTSDAKGIYEPSGTGDARSRQNRNNAWSAQTTKGGQPNEMEAVFAAFGAL